MSETVLDTEIVELVQPAQRIKGKRKKNSEVNVKELLGKHIDAVFKPDTFDRIERISHTEFTTRSELIRAAVDLWLDLKDLANPDDTLVVMDSNGKPRFVIPMRIMV